jgi:hypothetical protein
LPFPPDVAITTPGADEVKGNAGNASNAARKRDTFLIEGIIERCDPCSPVQPCVAAELARGIANRNELSETEETASKLGGYTGEIGKAEGGRERVKGEE